MPKKEVVTLDDITQQEFSGGGNIIQPPEIEAAFNALNDASFDKSSGHSKIELKSRLTNDEVQLMTIFKELKRIGFTSKQADLPDTIMHLKVSLDGKGRDDLVNIASGVNANKQGQGMFSKFFGAGNKPGGGV